MSKGERGQEGADARDVMPWTGTIKKTKEGKQGSENKRQCAKTNWFTFKSAYQRWYITLQSALLVITGLAIVVYGLQWKALRDQVAAAQLQIELSQRAVVSFGDRDGKVAEYVRPTAAGEQGSILLHFENSGLRPAKSFGVSAMAIWAPGQERHATAATYRFWSEYEGHGGPQSRTNPTISPRGTYTALGPPDVIPSPEEWTRIRLGVLNYHIDGFAQWCDNGIIQCLPFSALYVPIPVDRFVIGGGVTDHCLKGPPPEVGDQPNGRTEELYPCEEPMTDYEAAADRDDRERLWRRERELRRSRVAPSDN